MHSPISWFGGKANLSKYLKQYIPNHKIYIEVFGGGASLLFEKDPSISENEVYNDIDSGLVNFFRVFRDPVKFKILNHLITYTPYSREEYNFCLKNWDKTDNCIERAYRWFIVARMSFSGRFGKGWSYGVTSKKRSYFSLINEFKFMHDRFKNVQVENKDFRKILQRYDHKDAFFI